MRDGDVYELVITGEADVVHDHNFNDPDEQPGFCRCGLKADDAEENER